MLNPGFRLMDSYQPKNNLRGYSDYSQSAGKEMNSRPFDGERDTAFGPVSQSSPRSGTKGVTPYSYPVVDRIRLGLVRFQILERTSLLFIRLRVVERIGKVFRRVAEESLLPFVNPTVVYQIGFRRKPKESLRLIYFQPKQRRIRRQN